MNKHWFRSTTEIDEHIKDQYQNVWEQAGDGQLEDWLTSPQGCLALCIILDQFPLNMFRGTAKSFSTEGHAIEVTKHAIAHKLDEQLEASQVAFLYLPLMHSENIDDQDLCIQCFEKWNLPENLRFAKHHRSIIERFGRFPHRNTILDRISTDAEIEYLASKEAFTG